jgi:hypothetical protein
MVRDVALLSTGSINVVPVLYILKDEQSPWDGGDRQTIPPVHGLVDPRPAGVAIRFSPAGEAPDVYFFNIL